MRPLVVMLEAEWERQVRPSATVLECGCWLVCELWSGFISGFHFRNVFSFLSWAERIAFKFQGSLVLHLFFVKKGSYDMGQHCWHRGVKCMTFHFRFSGFSFFRIFHLHLRFRFRQSNMKKSHPRKAVLFRLREELFYRGWNEEGLSEPSERRVSFKDSKQNFLSLSFRRGWR